MTRFAASHRTLACDQSTPLPITGYFLNKNHLRVRSVPLGVDWCEFPTLLDVDVQTAGDEVVDEAELQLSLDGDGAVPALSLTVHAGHGLRPGAEAGERAGLHQLLTPPGSSDHPSQVWLRLGDVWAAPAARHARLPQVPQQVRGGPGGLAGQHVHPGHHGGGRSTLAGELAPVI